MSILRQSKLKKVGGQKKKVHWNLTNSNDIKEEIHQKTINQVETSINEPLDKCSQQLENYVQEAINELNKPCPPNRPMVYAYLNCALFNQTELQRQLTEIEKENNLQVLQLAVNDALLASDGKLPNRRSDKEKKKELIKILIDQSIQQISDLLKLMIKFYPQDHQLKITMNEMHIWLALYI